ncbi:MAG: PTS sugar transporter subunit IIA [Phycisphaerae bacterium]|jgi:mannitol/fructose-specific phosphotransferase system IIA component (Ntr-type)
MKITSVLEKSCVRVPLKATEKQAAITELVDVLDAAGRLADRDDVLKAILAREEQLSTGIGRGLAVPHGKSHGCNELTMAIGKPAAPLDFESQDRRPCQFIVLLASPVDKTGPHIQALGGIGRLWENEAFRRRVLEAKTAEELFTTIEHFDG